MTGAPYGSWGTGDDRTHGSGVPGPRPEPPHDTPPAPGWQPPYQRQAPHQPAQPDQPPYQPAHPYQPGQPYQSQQAYQGQYLPVQQPVEGARPYASFAQPQPPQPQQPQPPGLGSRPIGPEQPASVSISAYKPPRRRVGALLAFLVGFAVLIGGFMAAGYLTRTSESAASASPSATATLPGLPFETSSATGAWEITKTQWSSDHVLLTVRLTVATGSFRYSFYAYNNDAMKLSYPDSGSSSTLRSGTLASGQSVSGTLSFQISHGEGTLVMVDALENQVSGLPIKA